MCSAFSARVYKHKRTHWIHYYICCAFRPSINNVIGWLLFIVLYGAMYIVFFLRPVMIIKVKLPNHYVCVCVLYIYNILLCTMYPYYKTKTVRNCNLLTRIHSFQFIIWRFRCRYEFLLFALFRRDDLKFVFKSLFVQYVISSNSLYSKRSHIQRSLNLFIFHW